MALRSDSTARKALPLDAPALQPPDCAAEPPAVVAAHFALASGAMLLPLSEHGLGPEAEQTQDGPARIEPKAGWSPPFLPPWPSDRS